MSAVDTLRAAPWRRWTGLPIVLALLFATSTLAGTGRAVATGPVPMAIPAALQVVGAPAHQVGGQPPDGLAAGRGGPHANASALLAFGRASVPAVTLGGWCEGVRERAGQRRQQRHETYRGRGPPGRRAPDA